MDRRISMIGFLSLMVVVVSGCSLFHTRITREDEYSFGSVKFLDAASCTTLRVAEENTVRGQEGRLKVTITWENTSNRPFAAKMRRIFIDEQGLRERQAYEWDVQIFPPGETTLSWKSYSVSAVHYKIEVRAQD